MNFTHARVLLLDDHLQLGISLRIVELEDSLFLGNHVDDGLQCVWRQVELDERQVVLFRLAVLGHHVFGTHHFVGLVQKVGLLDHSSRHHVAIHVSRLHDNAHRQGLEEDVF